LFGVHVKEDVFSHGQLSVAFSRCGDPDNLCVFGPEPDEDKAFWIREKKSASNASSRRCKLAGWAPRRSQ
jgi:hypothetical protein